MNSGHTNPKPFHLLVILVLGALILFYFIALPFRVDAPTASNAPVAALGTTATATGTPTPLWYYYVQREFGGDFTKIPGYKQTPVVSDAQTRAASVLTYPPPLVKCSKPIIIVTSTPNPDYRPPLTINPTQTPIRMGAGILIPSGIGTPRYSSMEANQYTDWYEEKGDLTVEVITGGWHDQPNPYSPISQGFVAVWIWDHSGKVGLMQETYNTPQKLGPVSIAGAVGERLILRSDSGVAFYFDIPGRKFVSSMAEIAPTITLAPTFTLSTTLRPFPTLPSCESLTMTPRPIPTLTPLVTFMPNLTPPSTPNLYP